MKNKSFKKYDNLVVAKVENRKARYFFLKLPQRAIALGVIALGLIINHFIWYLVH